MTKKYFILVLIIFGTTSCDKYLSELPDTRAKITSASEVRALLTRAYNNSQFALFAESMSDNAQDKGKNSITNSQVSTIPINEFSYKWQDLDTEVRQESTSSFWSGSYTAIAHANQALASIAEIGDGSREYNGLKGEALLARAYAHFMLVNFFSLRYHPEMSKDQLGVPYVTEVENVAVKNYKRETVARVYELIEQDLLEGLKLINDDSAEPKYHFGTKSGNALASRFYLFKGEWAKVVDFSNRVLGSESPRSVIRDYVSPEYTVKTLEDKLSDYSSSGNRANLLVGWENSFYARYFYLVRYGFTSRFFSEFRTKSNPLNVNWNYSAYLNDQVNFFVPKYREYFRVTNPSANIGFANASVIHFTTDEVLLNRAEAKAMLDDFSGASSDLSDFISKKCILPANAQITPAGVVRTFPVVANEFTPFYTLSDQQVSFVKCIAEFRRREFIHEGHRWFDIKRFNLVVTHSFFDSKLPSISLEKDDPRRAIQIPSSALPFGIQPNPR